MKDEKQLNNIFVSFKQQNSTVLFLYEYIANTVRASFRINHAMFLDCSCIVFSIQQIVKKEIKEIKHHKTLNCSRGFISLTNERFIVHFYMSNKLLFTFFRLFHVWLGALGILALTKSLNKLSLSF